MYRPLEPVRPIKLTYVGRLLRLGVAAQPGNGGPGEPNHFCESLRALPVSKRTGGAGTTSAGNEFNGRFLGSWGKQRVKRMSRFVLARLAAGTGLATALVLLIPAGVVAAPVLSSTAVVKSAAGTALVDVRWRRRGWRRSSYFIGSPYYGYGRYSNSGCHVEGGYYRPNGCW